MQFSLIRLFFLALTAATVTLPAVAEGLQPQGYLLQAGGGDRGTWSVIAGVYWGSDWRRSLAGFEVSGVTEAFISHWDARAAEGRRGFTQIGVLPLRPDAGRSPWFAEAGIGLSTTHPIFETDRKRFSTAFNFVDVLGVGRSVGAARQHELGLRLQHVSNGGIRAPNPGQNFVQLRYAASF
jgi:lipid A 3-O-deacylase